MVLLTFYIRWPWIDGGKFNFDDGEMRLKKKRKNMGNRTTREREREREQSREGIFCFVGPGKLRTGSSVSAVAMPVHTRRTHSSYCVPPS